MEYALGDTPSLSENRRNRLTTNTIDEKTGQF
jgi:hypothetical protein